MLKMGTIRKKKKEFPHIRHTHTVTVTPRARSSAAARRSATVHSFFLSFFFLSFKPVSMIEPTFVCALLLSEV